LPGPAEAATDAVVKIYDSFGPNPRALRMVLAEKGLELPKADVDLLGGENRQGGYLAKNPGGQLPALELDDGRVLGETVAIFEYLEEKHPTPALIGTTPEERAEARMWQRRVELRITEHVYNGFRFGEGVELFRPRMRVLPEASDGLKATARDGLAWLDPLLAGKQWIAGDRFTIADVILYCALDFGRGVGQPIDPGLASVSAWFARVAERPSARRSLHPQAEAVGMNG
jgi:glutathione S-transferase